MSYTPTLPTPGALYAKNNVPVVTVVATENVRIQLRAGSSSGRIVFSGSYAPDLNGNIVADFTELFEAELACTFPNSTQQVQPDAIKTFHITVYGEEAQTSSDSEFLVCNTLTDTGNTAFETWADANFFTNQPREKKTTRMAPEWLTYYDIDAEKTIKVRFYLKAGGHEDHIICSSVGEGLVTVNVAWSRLITTTETSQGALLGYYDIILETIEEPEEEGDDPLETVFCSQRYILKQPTGREHYYLFQNALGGFDTMICQGARILQPSLSYEIGRFGRNYRQLDNSDCVRSYTQHIGNMPIKQSDWLWELLTAKHHLYIYDGSTFSEIVIENAELEANDNKQLFNASFVTRPTGVSRAIKAPVNSASGLHQSSIEGAEVFPSVSTN